MTRKEFSNLFQVTEIVANQLFELYANQYSEIIEADGKYTIFKVDERESTIPFSLVNRLMDKSSVRGMVDYAYRNIGLKETVILADRLKRYRLQIFHSRRTLHLHR